MEKQKNIYLDCAASTPVDTVVLEAMRPYWQDVFANAGTTIHSAGRSAQSAVETARQTTAECLRAKPEEIIFVSGGTEGNNLAIYGAVRALRKKGIALSDMHCITTVIEHSSVLDCVRELEREGMHVSYLPVDESGIVRIDALQKEIRPETVLVSVIYVSNEIGVIQPILGLSKVIAEEKKRRNGTGLPIHFHTDACQAPVYAPCHADELGVDLMTIDGQKIYGPKGIGVLYVGSGVSVAPLFQGGNQERGLRPGTPNTPLVAGLAAALHKAENTRTETVKHLQELRDHFISEVEKRIPTASFNGHRELRAANNANFSFPGMEGEFVAVALDERGISVSTRSACLGRESGGSYVVRALDKGEEHATSSVRFTLGKITTREELDCVVNALEKIVER